MISGQFRPKFSAGKWWFGVCRQVAQLTISSNRPRAANEGGPAKRRPAFDFDAR